MNKEIEMIFGSNSKIKEIFDYVCKKKWFAKFLLYNILSFLLLSYVMNIIERVLINIGVLKDFNLDLIPVFSINNFWKIYFCIQIIFFVIVMLVPEYKIIVKKYRYIFLAAIFIFEIFILYNYYDNYLFKYCLDLLITYCMINYISLEEYSYSSKALKREQSFNGESSVVDREKLQRVQVKALDQIILAIDRLEKKESMNIALIGAWGRGKTSIIDTFICEKEKNDYFILKINTLSMRQISNIIQYVNDYFSMLFKKHMPFSFAQWDNLYFSILAELFEKNNFSNYGKKILRSIGKHEFVDNEYERTVLSLRIQKLLKKEKKKKIILIIDDVDRTNIKDEIIKLLSEFSAIEGVVCLISLGDKYDISYRPIKKKEYDKGVKFIDGSYDCFDEIDKFIQLKIRIELEENAEYESPVMHEILKEHRIIKYDRCEYIACYNMCGSRPFLFEQSGTHDNNNSKILTEIFLENLGKREENLGDVLEEMITEYYRKCNPIFQYFEKNISKMDANVFEEARAAWNFENYPKNWMTILTSQATMMIRYIGWLYRGAENFVSSGVKLEDIYSLLSFGRRMTDYTSGIRSIAYEKYYLNILFTDEEQDIISKLVEEQNFDKLRKKLSWKYDQAFEFLQKAYLLDDFIIYLRDIMNNFRTLKMQLREANIMNLNYLEYLLENYEGSHRIKEIEKEIKGKNPYLSEKQFTDRNCHFSIFSVSR